MSVSELYSPLPKPWSNINVNTINSASASSFGGTMNLNDNGIVNVSSINGNILPPFNITLNPLNIIYRPGGPAPDPGSNIFTTWQAIINHASQININQIINIYFDNTVISPCPIDVSYDFQSRGNFFSYFGLNEVFVIVQINDGIQISNLSSINGSIILECQSLTGQNLIFSNNSALTLSYGAVITNTFDSVLPSLVIDSSNIQIYLDNFSYLSFNSVDLINVINNSFLFIVLDKGSNIDQTIMSDPSSFVVVYYTDTAYSPNLPDVSVSDFLPFSDSQSVFYNDNNSPQYNSTNVQGALDSIKGYLSASTFSDLTVTNNLTMTNVGGLLSNNGTTQLGINGSVITQVQFGNQTLTGFGGGIYTTSVSFPQAFASSPIVIASCQNQQGVGGITDVICVQVNSVSNIDASFNLYRVDSAGGGWGQTPNLSWMAIL